MELNDKLKDGLKKLGINTLTAIQDQCLEPATMGENIIGCSNTGTGKTFAYLLPVISANMDNHELYAVIICPSKELCIQICSQINQLSNNSDIPITAAALFGGVNVSRQLQTLKSKPNIVVGTYQRIYELIKMKKLAAHQVKSFIIDEADSLLNKDNFDGVRELRKCFMRDIQIMCFSASMQDKTCKMAEELSVKPFVKIFTNDRLNIPTNISHMYFISEKRDRIELTRKVIHAIGSKPGLIFCGSKYDTEELYQKLIFYKYNVQYLNANCDKNIRRQIIERFKAGKTDYLICSDVAARGLDFADIDVIINVGLPDKPIDYLHRAGRCGRHGQESICASIVSDNELSKIKSIQKAFGTNMMQKKLYNGKIVRK